jgi:Cu(I)/Ag(I) efflux system membrane fusion protein
MKDALVSDNFGKAKASGIQLLELTNNMNMDLFTGKSHEVWKTLQNEIKSELQHIEHFTKLDEVRDAFVNLSDTMISLANIFKPNETLFVLHCPMANNNKGADWLSSSKEIKNPYYGKAMLTCGEVKDTININK